MALIDLVKCDAMSDDVLVEKFGSEHVDELRIGTQLVVNESQEALLLKGGVALDIFPPGTHTLVTGNIPLLRKAINAVFGDQTPFTAEVWFINKTVKLDMRWGTPKRFAVMDPQFNFPVNVGAFGQWGFRIQDSRSFVSQIVGSQLGANSERIYSYFIGTIQENVARHIAERISGGLSITALAPILSELSTRVATDVSSTLARFGIELVTFHIANINIDPKEMAQIQEVLIKRMEMNVLGSTPVGQGYITAKSIEIMQDAARNSSAGGSAMAVGAGLGFGFGAALPVAQQMAQTLNVSAQPVGGDISDKLTKLKSLLDSNLITIADFDAAKSRLLDSL